MTTHKTKHSLSVGKSIQSRVYDADTGEEISFAKMSLDEAGLRKKREWVGLTDEEFEAARYWVDDQARLWKNIEAKLKEKNT